MQARGARGPHSGPQSGGHGDEGRFCTLQELIQRNPARRLTARLSGGGGGGGAPRTLSSATSQTVDPEDATLACVGADQITQKISTVGFHASCVPPFELSGAWRRALT